ncbi:MAG TPA: response regulator [Cyclobacteriaceae bacterium]
MSTLKHKSIFLADDDTDDRILFQDALREVSKDTRLQMANDGLELMDILEETVPPPPDVIFLDLNMPLKNGFECLADIKRTHKLKNIPVVIFSTSSQQDAIGKVYAQGAHYYICKPSSFEKLKMAISEILSRDLASHLTQPSREEFLLTF